LSLLLTNGEAVITSLKPVPEKSVNVPLEIITKSTNKSDVSLHSMYSEDDRAAIVDSCFYQC